MSEEEILKKYELQWRTDALGATEEQFVNAGPQCGNCRDARRESWREIHASARVPEDVKAGW